VKYVALNSYFLWPFATGGERMVLDILSGLRRLGHEVLIRYAIPPGLPEHAFETLRSVITRFGLVSGQCSRQRVDYTAGDVPVEAIGVPGAPPTWIGAWLDELTPDVVLIQAKDLLLLPALTAFWKGRGLALLQDEEALRSLTSSLTPVTVSRIASSSISMVASSRFLQSEATKRGFESSLFYPALTLLPVAPDSFVDAPITSFGTSPEKGVDIVTALAERMSDRSFRIVIGWNDRIPESNLSNLEFAPFTLDPSVFYHESSVVLVPSRCREGFGRIVHETMACGRVPVVSNQGALPEVAGEAGLVLPVAETDAELRQWDTSLRGLLSEDTLKSNVDRCRRRAEALTVASREQFRTVFGIDYPA
jgi:glycosyltransferase involved in cell wall biosynthesis